MILSVTCPLRLMRRSGAELSRAGARVALGRPGVAVRRRWEQSLAHWRLRSPVGRCFSRRCSGDGLLPDVDEDFADHPGLYSSVCVRGAVQLESVDHGRV